MSKLPEFASNMKCWRIFNSLVFGPEVPCPECGVNLMRELPPQVFVVLVLPDQVPFNGVPRLVALRHEAEAAAALHHAVVLASQYEI